MRLCQESLSLYRELGGLGGVVPCLETLAQVWCGPAEGATTGAAQQGRVERGVQLWSAMTALRERWGAPRPPAAQEACAQTLAVARAVLGAPAVAAAWAQGAGLSLEQALELATRPEP